MREAVKTAKLFSGDEWRFHFSFFSPNFPIHEAPLMSRLRATDLKVGLELDY